MQVANLVYSVPTQMVWHSPDRDVLPPLACGRMTVASCLICVYAPFFYAMTSKPANRRALASRGSPLVWLAGIVLFSTPKRKRGERTAATIGDGMWIFAPVARIDIVLACHYTVMQDTARQKIHLLVSANEVLRCLATAVECARDSTQSH